MKNLRKQHPLLKPFRDKVKQPVSAWSASNANDNIELCAQFILLPLIEANKTITPELITQTMPAAVDLERQASSLLADGTLNFVSIRDLLEKTTSLFLIGDETP